MSCENCEESAYVIDKLAKLLAEIAVIVNGPEPPLTSWSYHDLPEKVRALKQAPPATVPAGGLRDSVLNSAKFRASCYALVGIVEGIAGLGRRWASDGERLKDTPEWVAFYNSVSAMRNGTAEPTSATQAPPAAAAAVPEGMVMVQRADLAALEATDFGRCVWSVRADLAARRLRDVLLAAPQTPPVEWFVQWIRNNYQNHPNIASLCEAMREAANKENNND